MIRLTFALSILLSLAFKPVVAQNFQTALSAYQASDYATAIQEWTPLAEAGNTAAQFNLGLMYSTGKGVVQDLGEAKKWYLLAGEQGYAKAQYYLGHMYDVGRGVNRDHSEARKWYLLAAAQSNAKAQNNLAVIYEFGNGVLQDNILAHMWYNISSANGVGQARERRDRLADRMTPEDISKAQAMARECMTSKYQNCGY